MASLGPDPLEPILAGLESAEGRDLEDLWRRLYKVLWPWVLSHCWRVLWPDRERARDAAQEVFRRIFQYYTNRQKRLDAPAFRAYVATICRNCALDQRRQANIGLEVSVESIPEVALGTVKSEDDFQDIERKEELSKLYAALSKEEVRLIELMLAGNTVSEVASILGVTRGALAVRLFRLRRRAANLRVRQGAGRVP
jgi:RNA polymerase sigma-70 factor (ECF subfamily)